MVVAWRSYARQLAPVGWTFRSTAGMSVQVLDESVNRILWRWQVSIAAALLIGYTGYYLCRSNLAVAAPLMIADGIADRRAIGTISSAGVLSYALGKLVTGFLGDLVGGRTMFLVGLFGSVVATMLFGFGSSVGWFVAIWIINRFFQSAGWGGLVNIASHWFPAARYGMVMAMLSLSFLFGDAIGRYFLGSLIAGGLSWRSVFLVAAAVLAAIGAHSIVTLRSTPKEIGLPEPEAEPTSLFQGDRTIGLRELLTTYRSSMALWLVCVISFGLTLVREAFNIWTPAYLVDAHGLSAAAAAQCSSIFPFVGGFSTLATGWSSDRVGNGNRIAIAVPCLFFCTISLFVLAAVGSSGHLFLALAAIANVAVWLLGPYSLLAGAMALELGGRQGSATAAGLIDTAGYLGAAFSGFAIGRLVDAGGWSAAFQALAIVAGASAVAATVYWYRQHFRRSAAC